MTTAQDRSVDRSKDRARLIAIIKERSFEKGGERKLASGRTSNFYFNMKPTMLHAEGAHLIGVLVLDALKDDKVDLVGGLEMGAVPIAAAVAATSQTLASAGGRPISAFFVRKQAKDHGTQSLIEGLAKGETLQGKRVVVVEDVTTTGGSALKAAEAVRDAGGEIVLVFTMVDREEGATEAFAEAGMQFRSLYKASEFLKS